MPAELAKIWIVMKGEQPRALCTSEERAREIAGRLVHNFMGYGAPSNTAESVYIRVMFVDDLPADNETPQPARETCSKCGRRVGDGMGPSAYDCPGIAAPVAQQSAGAWKMTEADSVNVGEAALAAFYAGDHRSMQTRFVEAAVRLGIVVPAPKTKSLDADHPALSAARAELGIGDTRPDEGAGPSESVRHAARRESRDAGLDLDAIKARANAATPGPWETWDTKVLCGVEERTTNSRTFDHGGHEIANLDAMDYANALPEDMDDREAEEKGEADARADAEFVAHARTDIPALVAEVERLRAALASQRSEEKR